MVIMVMKRVLFFEVVLTHFLIAIIVLPTFFLNVHYHHVVCSFLIHSIDHDYYFFFVLQSDVNFYVLIFSILMFLIMVVVLNVTNLNLFE